MDIDYLKLEEMAQPGAFSRFDMEVFVPEIQKLETGDTYVELGVDRGRSLSVAEMFKNPGVLLYGIDLERPEILNEYLKEHKDITFLHGDTSSMASDWLSNNGTIPQGIDLLFVDADHTYEGCKKDIDAWYPHMSKGGVILFHDCDETSPGVVRAVNEFADSIGKRVEVFKTKEKNTSMAKIQL